MSGIGAVNDGEKFGIFGGGGGGGGIHSLRFSQLIVIFKSS
jgi:hypothetical protein